MLVRRSAVAAALIAAACVGSAGSATAQDGCEVPYSPIAQGGVPPYGELPPMPGRAVAVRALTPTAQLSSNGSAYIVQASQGPTVTVVLPTGTVELNLPGAALQALAAGDLDGDGISEVGVFRYEGGAVVETFIVRSNTAPGSYDLPLVGTRVPAGVPMGGVSWPGGTAVDVVLGVGAQPAVVSGSTIVVDGPSVLAAGPGGDATGAVRASLGGQAQGVVEYPSGPAVVVLEPTDGASRLHVVVASGTYELTTAPTLAPTYVPNGGMTVGISATLERDRRFLSLDIISRSGPKGWIWALDWPCDPIVAAAAQPNRPAAAEPRAAGLSFTG
jgi:hypothetical protein